MGLQATAARKHFIASKVRERRTTKPSNGQCDERCLWTTARRTNAGGRRPGDHYAGIARGRLGRHRGSIRSSTPAMSGSIRRQDAFLVGLLLRDFPCHATRRALRKDCHGSSGGDAPWRCSSVAMISRRSWQNVTAISIERCSGRADAFYRENWLSASHHFLRMPSLTPRRQWILEHLAPWQRGFWWKPMSQI
jgi:hypothetical protein